MDDKRFERELKHKEVLQKQADQGASKDAEQVTFCWLCVYLFIFLLFFLVFFCNLLSPLFFLLPFASHAVACVPFCVICVAVF